LNFGLAALLALGFTYSLSPVFVSHSSGTPKRFRSLVRYMMIIAASPPSIFLILSLSYGQTTTARVLDEMIWSSKVLGVWSLQLVCCLYGPFVLQAGIATLL
jgi:hypothetical protein